MMFPLVLDLAADGIPVAVTCRVLGFSKQAFYQWRADPVTRRDWDDAHLINTAINIHRDDPEFGYRFIADELPDRGITASRNRVNRLCSQQRLWSVHAKKRGLARKPGPPVHDDLVERSFTADRLDQLWLTDITEHPTAEGQALPVRHQRRLQPTHVGYSIGRPDDRPAGRRRPRQRCAADDRPGRHRRSLRPRQPVPLPRLRPRPPPAPAARIDGPGRSLRRQRRDGVVLRVAAEERPRPPPLAYPPTNSGSRSSPGSKPPTTAAAVNTPSVD